MIWFQRNLVALIGLFVFAVLVSGAVYELQEAKVSQAMAAKKNQELEDQFQQITKSPISPSPKNVEILQLEAIQLQNFYEDALAALPKPKKEYSAMPRWEFKGDLETQLQKLEQYCRTNRVAVPHPMAFGFSKYVGPKEPPAQEDIPMLLHQLDIVQQFVHLLVQSKVVEIGSVRRTYLKNEGDSPPEDRVPGGEWNTNSDKLYQSQNLEATFRCTFEELRNTMNNLAVSTNILVLVRSVSVECESTFPSYPQETAPASAPSADTSPAPAPNPAVGTPMRFGRGMSLPAKPGATGPTEIPVVLGNEMATVSLRLDVIEMNVPEEKKKDAVEPAPKKALKNRT